MSTASLAAVRVVTAPSGDDERSLLIRFELMLEREEEAIVAHDAAAIVAIAEEREHLTERLGEAARLRRCGATPTPTPADEADLVELYRRLRHRHEVRARVVRRHAEKNARALGVLAQASGQTSVYRADGSVAKHFA